MDKVTDPPATEPMHTCQSVSIEVPLGATEEVQLAAARQTWPLIATELGLDPQLMPEGYYVEDRDSRGGPRGYLQIYLGRTSVKQA
ncbi:hypothetical protein HY346_01360 [Candidatus Microgenomates bacterium]|nr:hypothetical protein [Candidatus Microgenomates bacterium]